MRKGSTTVSVKLVCATPGETLHQLNEQGILLMGVHYEDELTVSFCVRRTELNPTTKIIEQSGGRCVMVRADWLSDMVRRIRKRLVLICGMMAMVLLTLYFPHRIFFVQVEGNRVLPAKRIIAAAENCDLSFGVSRQQIRSERIKNALLADLPELQWVGVNTQGCVASICVKERIPAENEPIPGISSIIANYDGIVSRISVLSGTQICKVGQAVKKGDLLVSGYSDCGICIYGTTSVAEIFADTQRILTIVTPSTQQYRSQEGAVKSKFSLLIGKKRINFYKGSGIYDTTCGKMYSEIYLTLPGGFDLPFGIGVEKLREGSLTTGVIPESLMSKTAEVYANQYLDEQMIAGTILECKLTSNPDSGVLRINGIYLCNEMIGKTRYEEIIGQYGETS